MPVLAMLVDLKVRFPLVANVPAFKVNRPAIPMLLLPVEMVAPCGLFNCRLLMVPFPDKVWFTEPFNTRVPPPVIFPLFTTLEPTIVRLFDMFNVTPLFTVKDLTVRAVG